MENKTKWYRDPDVITKIIAVAFLVLLGCCIHFFAQDFFDKTLKLAISGNVNALAEYLRSFGPWAIVISFLLDVFINAASIFPSIFLSTANGLIFGLPLGILISWLAETVGLQWMAFARALPYFPSGILTAIGALSKISVGDYIIANLIGKFPSTALEVVIGHDIVNFKQNSMRLTVLVIVTGIVFFAYKRYKK